MVPIRQRRPAAPSSSTRGVSCPAGCFSRLPASTRTAMTSCRRRSLPEPVAAIVTRPVDAAEHRGGRRNRGAHRSGFRSRPAAAATSQLSRSPARRARRRRRTSVAQLLERLGPTVAPPESFNNELGHPYTVLLSTVDTRYLVLETSARGIGHIRHLTDIAPPRIGAVLNIGSAHLGMFGSRDAIALAKGELVEALPAARTVASQCSTPTIPLVAAMSARTTARVVTVGESASARTSARPMCNSTTSAARLSPCICAANRLRRRQLRTDRPPSGRQRAGGGRRGDRVRNVARRCRRRIEPTCRARSRWRMELRERADGVVIVNDAYNANPESMRAALEALDRSGAQPARPNLGGARADGRTRRRGRRRARCARPPRGEPVRGAHPSPSANRRNRSHVQPPPRRRRAPGTARRRGWRTRTRRSPRCGAQLRRRRRRSGKGVAGGRASSASRWPSDAARVEQRGPAGEDRPRGGTGRPAVLDPVHAARRAVLPQPRVRAGDPQRRAADPHDQARHADDGRGRHHRVDHRRLLRRPYRDRLPGRPRPDGVRPAAAVPHGRARCGRLPRRLHQAAPPAQPRTARPGEVRSAS